MGMFFFICKKLNTCDKLNENNYCSESFTVLGVLMESIDLKEKKTEEMRVIFRFSAKPKEEDLIKREIKAILVSSLHEQLNRGGIINEES